MLVLDFINVGNGDSILVREMEGERLRFSMLVDCGHDSLERDDHPPVEDPRSCRIFAGDFLRSQGVAHLDILLVTHFHRDHIGGLGRVLETVTIPALWTRTETTACPRQRGTCCGVWTCTPAPCSGTETGSAGSRSCRGTGWSVSG